MGFELDRQICRACDYCLLAPIEMFTTFARLQRDGAISENAAQLLQFSLLTDMVREYLSIPLDPATLTLARTLTTRHTLRTLDAIQLACVLIATIVLDEPSVFVSGDNRLLTAAASEGFVTDNPYLHS